LLPIESVFPFLVPLGVKDHVGLKVFSLAEPILSLNSKSSALEVNPFPSDCLAATEDGLVFSSLYKDL